MLLPDFTPLAIMMQVWDQLCDLHKQVSLTLRPPVSTIDLLSCLFVRFLLKDGQLWLCAPQAKQIWKCLAENAVFLCDREACFKWYCLILSFLAFGLN